MSCPEANEYGHGCVLPETECTGVHVCSDGDEWFRDADGNVQWVSDISTALLTFDENPVS